jgi:phthiocerol/phenolphthiocerol synthesis type-I polyketide synthase B
MTAATPREDRSDIALVGIGCRFPGGVVDSESFWAFLCEGKNAIGDIPSDRIDIAAFFDPDPAASGKMMVNRGGYLERIDEFDAAFFGISPREADVLDPQQRLLLETAWEALEDAGLDAAKLEGSRTGVYIGQWTSDFEGRLFAHPEAVDFHATQGSGRYASSGRISYALGLRGPSMTLDTACSSSLVAVHLAAQSIRSGESEVALAGAANIILQPQISIAYSQARMLAQDGQCKFGDISGDGYVRSEGVAVVVLKSLARAVADRDRIYAVVRGSAVGNDGNSSGLMGRPSQIAQEEVLRLAYEDAGVSASRIGYVEAHGTGTRAGDPVELKTIAAVAGGVRPADQPLFVGSVKTNWGHTEAAAGFAGLIKGALILKHGSIPPSLHRSTPNPSLTPAELALIIPNEIVPFPRGEDPGIVGVTAFGISGTNAHVVLEEAPPPPAVEQDPFARWAPAVLLPLSARSPQALQALAKLMADRLESAPAEATSDICCTVIQRRTALPHRAAFAAENRSALVEALHDFAEDDGNSSVVYDKVTPKIAFVCPGQGAQWVGMARHLMEFQPSFLAALTECDRAASRYVDYSIVAQLGMDPGAKAYRLEEISVIQPVLAALAIAYARLLRDFGVIPSAVVGHSMGEVAAAVIAGVIDIDRGMQIVCRRSALMQRKSGQGAMAVVELPIREAAKRIADWEGQVNAAVSNSPRSCVISGDTEAVRQIMAELERDGVFCRAVKVDVASHSPQMDEAAAGLVGELAGLSPVDGDVPIWSTVLGRRAEGSEFGTAYWGRNLREPVLFAEAVNELLDTGISLFVELGPHPVLLHAIEQTAGTRGVPATTVACGRNSEGEGAAFLSALGQLWSGGCQLAWGRILTNPGRFASLPLYPWQRERHWAPTANRVSASLVHAATQSSPDHEALSWIYAQTWKASDPQPSGHVTPAARYLIIADDVQAQSLWQEAFAAEGAQAVFALWDSLDQVIDSAAGDTAVFKGLLLLMPEGPEATYLPVRALQAALKSRWRTPPQLWFVTRGAQAADPHGEGVLSIDHAAIWGACRVIAEEHPDLWGGLVDLDPTALGASDAALVARHILARDGEDQIAIRDNRRFVLRLVEKTLDEATDNTFRLRQDASYLITGGLGDIALRLARTMAKLGARRLVLIGRSALPPRNTWGTIDPGTTIGQRVAAVRALEADGIAVQLASVDVSDESALREFLDEYEAEAWPPIRGVVHAAGALDDGLAVSVSRARFDALLDSKLRGAQHLDRLLPELDFFALMSSTAAFMAQTGQVSYAAANAGLDALARNRRSRGLPAISVAWGVWEDTGLMMGEDAALKFAEMNRQGMNAIPPGRGANLFPALCQSGEPYLAVLPLDQTRFKQARLARSSAIFADIIAAAAAVDATETQGQAESNLPEGGDDLNQIVHKAVGAVLKISPSRLDPRKPLGAMGLTSLMAIELRNTLEGTLKRPLSATLAWNHPTIEALVEFLGAGSSKPSEISIQDNDSASAPSGIELAALSDLSDAEVLAALRNVSGAR